VNPREECVTITSVQAKARGVSLFLARPREAQQPGARRSSTVGPTRYLRWDRLVLSDNRRQEPQQRLLRLERRAAPPRRQTKARCSRRRPRQTEHFLPPAASALAPSSQLTKAVSDIHACTINQNPRRT
jgi:hypothetical protein